MKIATLLFITIVSISSFGFSQSVIIGTQTWTALNLDVATFRNGDPITLAKTNEEWEAAGVNNQPAWCYYENDTMNGTKYGKLYNWYAVNDARGLAPTGWHIPTDEEWTVLETFLGGGKVAGEKIKSSFAWDSIAIGITCANCESWNTEYREKVPCHTCKDTRINGKKTYSGNGSNTSGFCGLPGGCRDDDGGFASVGRAGGWWSASEGYVSLALYRRLYASSSVLGRYNSSKDNGFSVRCVKD